MSWIKIEKDLLTDPRVHRIATQLRNGGALQGCDATPSQAVTVVLGALVHLWILADTHIGNDDVLPLGTNEINEIIGVQNFCELVPRDWLQIIDAHNVKLPDFHAHNGTIAKERAQTQKRTQRYRKFGNAQASHTRDGRASPDLDLDQEYKKKPSKEKKSTAQRLPSDWDLSAARSAYAKAQSVDPDQTFMDFRDYWNAASGASSRKHDWDSTWRMWCRRAARSRAPNGHAPSPARDIGAWAEARAAAKEIGFREPYPAETASSYLDNAKRERERIKIPAPVPQALLDKMRGLRA